MYLDWMVYDSYWNVNDNVMKNLKNILFKLSKMKKLRNPLNCVRIIMLLQKIVKMK